MKIVKLIAENFKRLTAVTIKPDGSLVVVGGVNGAGKSSSLDAIESALGGKSHAPTEPIRKGAKSARVVVQTDEFTVTRRFTAKGSTLEIRAKDGAVFPSPQEMLNRVVGSLSFDPLVFTRLKPTEQAETLRRLVGLDLSREDAARQAAYDKRTDVGREIKRLEGALAKLPEVPGGVPDAEASVSDLAAELDRCMRARQDNEAKRARLGQLRARAEKQLEVIAAAEKHLAEARAELDRMTAEGKALRAEVDALTDPDVDAAKARLTGVEETNRAVRAKRDRAKLQAELDAAIDESEKLTQRIGEIDTVKAEAAANARYPIEGLAITDTGVTLAGVPFEQASQAEKLRASVAIGLALNPEFKVLLIRDGSLLDERNLAVIATMAEEAGAQVWLERVGAGDECTVVIDDGHVAGAEPSTDAP
jgi:DNA repair exonuclease SbcCD ATPase subunit